MVLRRRIGCKGFAVSALKQKGERMARIEKHAYKPVLYISEGEDDSLVALKFLRTAGIEISVVVIKEKDDETVTPYLDTPISAFYGLMGVKSFILYNKEG